MSGSKFYYLRGAATLLELALVNWALSRVAAKGFELLSTPDLVRGDVLEKCGFQPRGDNTQVCVCVGGGGGGGGWVGGGGVRWWCYVLINDATATALRHMLVLLVVVAGVVVVLHPVLSLQLPCLTHLCCQVYSVRDSPLCLTGTAEVPLAGVYMDKV